MRRRRRHPHWASGAAGLRASAGVVLDYDPPDLDPLAAALTEDMGVENPKLLEMPAGATLSSQVLDGAFGTWAVDGAEDPAELGHGGGGGVETTSVSEADASTDDRSGEDLVDGPTVGGFSTAVAAPFGDQVNPLAEQSALELLTHEEFRPVWETFGIDSAATGWAQGPEPAGSTTVAFLGENDEATTAVGRLDADGPDVVLHVIRREGPDEVAFGLTLEPLPDHGDEFLDEPHELVPTLFEAFAMDPD